MNFVELNTQTETFDKSSKEQYQCTGKAKTWTKQEIQCSFEMNMEYWLGNRTGLPLNSQILKTWNLKFLLLRMRSEEIWIVVINRNLLLRISMHHESHESYWWYQYFVLKKNSAARTSVARTFFTGNILSIFQQYHRFLSMVRFFKCMSFNESPCNVRILRGDWCDPTSCAARRIFLIHFHAISCVSVYLERV